MAGVLCVGRSAAGAVVARGSADGLVPDRFDAGRRRPGGHWRFRRQLRAEKQAREREGRERRAALERDERQREQEREVWARSLRYEAHVLFLKTHDELYKTAQRADVSGDYGGPNQDPPDY